MSKNGDFRKQFIINPRFQYRMIGNVMVLVGIIVGVLYLADLFLFYRLNETGKNIGLPPEHVYFLFINQQKVLMNWIFLATASAVTMLAFAWGLLHSNRIAGPIYRLCKHLREITERNVVEDVNFRKNDYFPELADSVNLFFRHQRNSEGKNTEKETKSA